MVTHEVHRAIEELVGRSVMPADDLVRDLGLDSLTLTSLAVELEDRFRIKLDEVGGERPHTVADVVALVLRRLEEAP
jgi:acyl carrier protein